MCLLGRNLAQLTTGEQSNTRLFVPLLTDYDEATAMGSSPQVQPWKTSSAVADYMSKSAQSGERAGPLQGRANFYPKGAMMYNGGQSTGDGGNKVLYDTGKDKTAAQVVKACLSLRSGADTKIT